MKSAVADGVWTQARKHEPGIPDSPNCVLCGIAKGDFKHELYACDATVLDRWQYDHDMLFKQRANHFSLPLWSRALLANPAYDHAGPLELCPHLGKATAEPYMGNYRIRRWIGPWDGWVEPGMVFYTLRAVMIRMKLLVNPWSSNRGPASAVVATLIRIGWSISEDKPNMWHTDCGLLDVLDTQPRTVVQLDRERERERERRNGTIIVEQGHQEAPRLG